LVYAVETAGGWRGLFAQGEYFRYQISRTGLATANFDGGYGALSWVLTGEHRTYNRLTGAYTGILPNRPFSRSAGGYGAWELVARVSYADLTDHFVAGSSLTAQPNAVNGGKQTDYTVGVNWYPNSLLRFMFNYVHTDLRKANDTVAVGAPLGVPVGTRADGIALRLQAAF
jgi:phosphate-selective porin OprO/OprP